MTRLRKSALRLGERLFAPAIAAVITSSVSASMCCWAWVSAAGSKVSNATTDFLPCKYVSIAFSSSARTRFTLRTICTFKGASTSSRCSNIFLSTLGTTTLALGFTGRLSFASFFDEGVTAASAGFFTLFATSLVVDWRNFANKSSADFFCGFFTAGATDSASG